MAAKKRHHYVPQFYLRGFADPKTPKREGPYLWVRDIKTGLIAKRTPKNLAVESGYYAIETQTGKDYETFRERACPDGRQGGFRPTRLSQSARRSTRRG